MKRATSELQRSLRILAAGSRKNDLVGASVSLRWKKLASLLLIACMASVFAGCPSSGSQPIQDGPEADSVDPNQVPEDSPDTPATITGKGIVSPVVEVNGQPVPTTPVSTTEVKFTLPSSFTSTPGTLTVVVVNLLPSGNVTSNALTITVTSGGGGGAPAWTITKTHTGNFSQGQTGATFTITATNSGTGSTNGSSAMVSDTIPTGLTATAASGTGWGCAVAVTVTCSRSDALAADSSYPPITLTVTVATNAPSSITNTVTISGGGATAPGSGSDTVTVTAPQAPAWTITKTHTGNFTQGQTGATFTITVKNSGTGPTNGTTVTVTDAIPSGLTATGATGTGWGCGFPTTNTCTRSDTLAANSSYPPITLTVNVATNAPATITNMISISGGGAPPATGSDTVTVTSAGAPSFTITKTHTGNFPQGGTGSYTITIKNTGTGPTNGSMVTVTDTVPNGLLAPSATGTGWSCNTVTLTVTCQRSDALAANSSYPAITLDVAVSTSAGPTVLNTVAVSGGGVATPATAQDPTVITGSGGAADVTITGSGPASMTEFSDTTILLTVENVGGSPTSGTVTVTVSISSSFGTPTGLTGVGDPWSCNLATLTCTRNDALPVNGSYPPIAFTFQVAPGVGANVTVTGTVSGGGETNTSNDTVNVITPVVACTPSSVNLCGQYLLFVQGYTSAGPKAIVASFTADGSDHIAAGILDLNSMGAPATGIPILTTAPTAYNFESNGFGNVIFNTSAGVFVFKFIPNSTGNFANVIEFEPNGTSSGSGFMIQQTPAYSAASVGGSYALGLIGGLGGASAGVRVGMVGAVNANGTCGFSASGATGTLNNGGTISNSVNYTGTLNPASCSVDPITGRGTGTLSSVTGSPALAFSTIHFVYYLLGILPTGYASSLVVLSTDQTSATQPLLSGSAALQSGSPFNTNSAIDCGVAGNPSGSLGCVFASSGATGGNSLTGNAHVSAGRATVTTESNTAGGMSLLIDDNKGGVLTSGTVAATYSYAGDGTGVITPASGEPIAFVLIGTDTGVSLGTGGSVAFGSFSTQTATTLSSPQLYLLGTEQEGSINVTNTLATASPTPSSPGSNNGSFLGFQRFWNSSTHQNANMVTGNYTTDPTTGRGTGTTNISGASSMSYFVTNPTSIVLIGLTSGDPSPVLMIF